MTFIGWISGLPLLASVRAKYIPMAPSTALCFSLLGIGIILQIVQPSLGWISRAIAALVLMIACVKLAEFLGGFHLSIDDWFVRNPGMFGAVPTGRMAPMTALNFVFTAAGLFALTGRRRWAGAFGMLATIISAVVIVGYWYGTTVVLRRNSHSRRAFNRVRLFPVWRCHCHLGRCGAMASTHVPRRLDTSTALTRLCSADCCRGSC
jgi:hypothetical protein